MKKQSKIFLILNCLLILQSCSTSQPRKNVDVIQVLPSAYLLTPCDDPEEVTFVTVNDLIESMQRYKSAFGHCQNKMNAVIDFYGHAN